jgi:general secretion pathway protein L
MMLYLWMPEGQAPWRWRTTGEWHIADSWDALLAATAPEQLREVTVFFPTASAQLLRQPMSRGQLRQLGTSGVRYLLEEYALGSVEQLDVRYEMNSADQVTLMALPSETVAGYIAAMALGPWQLHALLPDFLLLPLLPNQSTLLLDGTTRLLRIDEWLAMPADDLSVILPRLPDLTSLTVLGESSASDHAALAASGLLLDPQDLALLPPPLLQRHPFNVLPKPAESGLSPYWRTVAAVLVLAVLVQVLHDGLSAWRDQRIAVSTQAQAEQQFREWFPEEQRIVNLRRQVESHLQGTSNMDMTALSLLARVGPVMQQAQLVARSVHYRDERLELDILASRLDQLETLRSQLTEQGLSAELGAVTPSGSSVSGLIRIKP